MNLKEYIEQLNKIVSKNPKYGEFPLIYSKDDEGNAYHHIVASPKLITVESLSEYYLEVIEDDNIEPNCIIIN